MSYPISSKDLIDIRRIYFPDYIWDSMGPENRERVLSGISNKLKELESEIITGVLKGAK